MSYTPKGITPLPWEDGAKGYSITGPTTPVYSGVTVREAIEHRRWSESFDEGRKEHVPYSKLPKCPTKTSVPIVKGQKTIAVAVGETSEEAEAHSAYLVHAANEYPHAIDALREVANDLERAASNNVIWLDTKRMIAAALKAAEEGR